MRGWVIACILAWASAPVMAQFNLGFYEEPSAPAIQIGVALPDFPSGGGLNTPQFSEIDLDGDGVKDLFVFDRSVDVVRTWRYDPTAQDYEYAPEFEGLFPDELAEFVLLRDFDCDGMNDIFTYHQAGFRVFRNTSLGSSLSFEKVTDKVLSDYGSFETGAFVLAGDVPAIVDVDNDGDLDILTFGTVNSENTIEYHRNLSQDLYNSCDSLVFEVATQCWGNVQEPVNSSSFSAITCKGIVPPIENRDRFHPGSTVLLIDMDGDGDKDLIAGDIQTDDVVFALNAGDAQTATIDVNSQTSAFPNAQDPIQMQYLVAGYEIDVNHDGQMDLIMSVNNSIDSSTNAQHAWYYRNTNSGAPSFTLESEALLLDEVMDEGANTSILIAELSGDDALDLLVAIDYKRTPSALTKSRIFYFKNNNGTFVLEDDDVGNASNFNFRSIQLAMGDLDADADDDLLIGDAEGFLHLFTNNPVNGAASFSLTQPQYMGINSIGNNASPVLADLNEDDLLDLVVGDRTGRLSYFENTGSSSSAFFSTAPSIAAFGGVDVSELCCTGYATPYFIQDPDFGVGRYLIVGSDEKRIDIYEVPNDLNSPFNLVDSIVVNAGRLDPQVVDLNGSGILELISGEAGGGIKYFERDQNYLVGTSPIASGMNNRVEVFPNPSRGELTVNFDQAMPAELLLMDISGSIIQRFNTPGEQSINLQLTHLSSGTYFFQIKSASLVQTERIIILQP